MNEYCDFMQKYSENPGDMSVLMEYATYMAKYEEAMDKIDALDDIDMNNAELSYYLAATARIEQRYNAGVVKKKRGRNRPLFFFFSAVKGAAAVGVRNLPVYIRREIA